LGLEWFPDPRIDVCNFDVTRYADYNSIEDMLRNERKNYYYPLNDSKIIFVCAQGSPGMEEYQVSLKDPLPEASSNETAVFRNGQWSHQDISSGRPIESDSSKQVSGGDKKTLLLKKSDFPDVYWVIHPDSKKNLGAARVRSLQESQVLRELFLAKEEQESENNPDLDLSRVTVSLPCLFEEEFMKWRPVLSNYLNK
jgi:hypothetical protein